MAPSMILSVAGALLALGSATFSSAQNGEGLTTYTVTLGKEGECLTEIDEAREAAGLEKFVQPTADEPKKRLPLDTTKAAWDPLCKDLLSEGATRISREAISDFEEGTYAFNILSSSKVDCSETVDHWKGAHKNFEGLPPTYSANVEVYKDKLNVSFVAMYNPSSGATADCRLATCTEVVAEGRSGPESQNRQAFIFICMTTPDILVDNKAPFTQEEWNKISSAITGSAAVAFPSFIVVAMTVLSIAML
ncbi:SAG family member [Eimeria mitis]|uniref:SAG family member n=1 Tax=Eimeria mitis TaxID=44415 RepID=U6K3P6_9EIME|nr:SAG family member [Eimeria mitis]CDJ30947.1 SAG family member [Eimeria mitis]